MAFWQRQQCKTRTVWVLKKLPQNDTGEWQKCTLAHVISTQWPEAAAKLMRARVPTLCVPDLLGAPAGMPSGRPALLDIFRKKKKRKHCPDQPDCEARLKAKEIPKDTA